MNPEDISSILNDWPYESGRINARIISAKNSDDEKLQIRLELGILQMELTHRPDGQQPHGHSSLLDYQLKRAEEYRRTAGSTNGFVLSPEECQALREEAVQFYHRYVALLAVQRFDLIIQDTTHNLRLFDFCREHAANPQDQHLLEQFRPHVLATRARAQAELALQNQQPRAALEAIDLGLQELHQYFQDNDQLDAFEQSNEAALLRGMRDTLIPKLPASQRHEMQERLRAALAAENYELAAILRDELRMMND